VTPGAGVATARPVGRILTWHPGWLGVVLGTGGVAVASLVDPLGVTTADGVIGAVLTTVAVLLLVVLGVPYLLRARRHRHALLADLTHPGLGATFGTLPASLLIVSVALAQLGVLGWLPRQVAWLVAALLVAGVVGALAVGVEFFSRVARAPEVPAQAMTGSWFIPIVVLVLAPSATARLTLLEPTWATTTTVALSAALWGAGVVLFVLLAPILGWRLITVAPPAAAHAASWWIWLAPAGAGGLGVLALARLAARVLGGPATVALPSVALLAAVALWGFGTWWALFAGRVVRGTSRGAGGLPFTIGSWGFVFPTAAMAALTVELGRSWDSAPITVAGAAWWVAALAIWARLAWQTVAGVRDGSIFLR
jgi:C4-dicarboxylate transporter/malic acid transport protein